MTATIGFIACRQGVQPKFHSTDFNVQFREWQQMRDWCEQQGWKMNYDFLANGQLGKPWYFRTQEQQMWFTLRWSS